MTRPLDLRERAVGLRRLALCLAMLLAAGGCLTAWAVNLWPALENYTVDQRFDLRGAQPTPRDIVIVGIDDQTFSALNIHWPFPRRLDGQVINILHRDHARTIAFDVQFTEPTDRRDDDALYDAVKRAGNVVLATTEVNGDFQTNVLGGEANLRSAHAVAAAANLAEDGDGVIRSYPFTMFAGHLPSFAAATAAAVGQPVHANRFTGNDALIDFRGPPRTFQTVSFSSVLEGRVAPSTFAGRIVVVGATSPTLQDYHATSTTTGDPMAGAEVQANAIWTALHGNPLTPGPGWLAALTILLAGIAAPLLSLRLRVISAALAGLVVGCGYFLVAELAFDRGTVLAVSYPLVACATGIVAMLAAHYTVAAAERNAFLKRLSESQLELVHRLTQAVDTRDAETGEHTFRIGELCRRVALAMGWSAADAQTLLHASIAHDIGKIGIPDSILLKPDKLDPAEQKVMRSHTTIGAELLADSRSPLLQMAESIALTHHECWDGSGYPAGLKGEEIPIAGRICAVVDVYDALRSERVYKLAWGHERVLDEIRGGSGTRFDPQVVAAFLTVAPQISAEFEASLEREFGADLHPAMT